MSSAAGTLRFLRGRWSVAVVGVVCLSLGIVAGRYRVFPYPVLASLKRVLVAPPAHSRVPVGLDYRERVALFASSSGPVDLVMLGDSIVARGDWVDLAAGGSVANRGIPLDTAAGLRARVGDVIRLKPKTVLVMIGVNDFLADRSIDETYADYAAVLDALVAAKIVAVVQATLFVGTRNPYFFEVNAKIAALNERIEKLAEAKSIAFFDTNRVLAPSGVLANAFTVDGVHPNSLGYRCWVFALTAASRHGWASGDLPAAQPRECDLASMTYQRLAKRGG